MKRLDPNLVFVFVAILIFLAALLLAEWWFPNDGQIFQVVAGLLTGTGAVFLGAARHAFGLPEQKEDGTVSKTTQTVEVTKTVTPPVAEK